VAQEAGAFFLGSWLCVARPLRSTSKMSVQMNYLERIDVKTGRHGRACMEAAVNCSRDEPRGLAPIQTQCLIENDAVMPRILTGHVLHVAMRDLVKGNLSVVTN